MKEISLKVNGMVCSGCENRVKNALENIDGVENVIASHENSIIKLTSKEEIEEDMIIKKIEDLGFEIIKED